MANVPESLKELASWARNRPNRDDQAIVIITGPTGVGKSSLGLLFADLVEEGQFEPEIQVVWTLPDWKAARRMLPQGKVIMDDEAVKSGGNRGRSQTRSNLDKMEDLNVGRKRCHIMISIIPYLDDLDRRQLKHVHWVLKVERRGSFVAMEVQRVGLQKVGVWLEPRFRGFFPDVRTTRPDLWEPYIKGNRADLDEEERVGLEAEERIRRFEKTLRTILSIGRT